MRAIVESLLGFRGPVSRLDIMLIICNDLEIIMNNMKIMKADKFVKETRILADFNVSEVNKEIFEYYSQFVDSGNELITCLIHDPFCKPKDTASVRKRFGKEIYRNIIVLKRLHDNDPTFFRAYEEYRAMILLFLINYLFLADKGENGEEKHEMWSQEKVQFALRLTESNDVGEIKRSIQDKLFSVADPELFNKYHLLLKASRATYQNHEKDIKDELSKLLKKINAKGKIESRFKSTYGVHRKLVNRNILFSQVLDVIGLRVIVDTESECYDVMESILSRWPSINTKIKDYIVLPKPNGYRSIHITSVINNQPVEIQIRTYHMHKEAQFGTCAHIEYKKSDLK